MLARPPRRLLIPRSATARLIFARPRPAILPEQRFLLDQTRPKGMPEGAEEDDARLRLLPLRVLGIAAPEGVFEPEAEFVDLAPDEAREGWTRDDVVRELARLYLDSFADTYRDRRLLIFNEDG